MQTYRHESGQVFMLGCELPSHPGKLSVYGDSAPVYDRQTILDQIAKGNGSLYKYCYQILDQGQRPWCWAYSGTQTLMVLLNMLYGDKAILDPSMGPAITHVSGGNSIDAMILEVQSVTGQATASFMKTDPTISKTNTNVRTWPTGWEAEAAKRKGIATDRKVCDTILSLASALLEMPGDPARPGDIGVSWQGRGHALTCLEVGSDDGKTLYLAGPNSWGTQFSSGWGSYPGRPGWYKLTERQLGGTFGGFGAYALVHATLDGGTPVNPVDPGPCPDPIHVSGPIRDSASTLAETAASVKSLVDTFYAKGIVVSVLGKPMVTVNLGK